MRLLTTKEEIKAQYKSQDFIPYQKQDGRLVLVSEDLKYYYYPSQKIINL